MQNDNNFKVNPQYLAGFFDGEGSVFVQIRYRAKYALKFGIFYALTFHQNNLSFNRWLKSQLNDFGGSQLIKH
jgi:intein-encoded DNA endonuclease-like protein